MNSYQKTAKEIGDLVTEKQEAYGDAFGKAGAVLREMYPDGIKPEQYDDMLCNVRILDKLFRIATKKDAFGESPYRDIAGYGLLGAVRDEAEKPCIEYSVYGNRLDTLVRHLVDQYSGERVRLVFEEEQSIHPEKICTAFRLEDCEAEYEDGHIYVEVP